MTLPEKTEILADVLLTAKCGHLPICSASRANRTLSANSRVVSCGPSCCKRVLIFSLCAVLGSAVLGNLNGRYKNRSLHTVEKIINHQRTSLTDKPNGSDSRKCLIRRSRCHRDATENFRSSFVQRYNWPYHGTLSQL